MSELKNRILLIRTGGTIDSEQYDDLRNPPPIVETLKGEDSLVNETVSSLPNGSMVDGYDWGNWWEDRFVKDSQTFTKRDIKELARIIRHDDHRYFVLTHGTDAMAKNASALQKELEGTDKVVVFTGAMVPLSMGDYHKSDGIKALKYTLNNIMEDQAPGVYVAARDSHSKRLQFFNPTTIEKNKDASKADLIFTVNQR